MLILNSKNKYVRLYFLGLIFIGIFIFKDFGISWDEPISRNNGAVSVKYALETIAPGLLFKDAHLIPNLKDYRDQDYGVAFEAPTFILEKILGLTQAKDIYLFRHLLTFFVFLAGVAALYLLARNLWGDWRIGLLAATFLVCSPRFFAEAFYNSKDIVFMSAFIVAANTMMRFLIKPTIRVLVVHALVSAIAIDVRIMGILIVASTVTALTIQLFKHEFTFRKYITYTLLYLALTFLFVIAMFPWLWENPYSNFVLALKNMTAFRWPGNVMYMGSYIKASELPWHYALVWIAITTPILYLIFFLIGSLRILRTLVFTKWKVWTDRNQMQDVIFLGLFWSPILAVIILHSVLYDGWRQLYFVYPFFILISINGFVCLTEYLAQMKIILYLFYIAVFISLLFTIRWMYKYHPYQNVYFNHLVSKPIRGKFELDYWGLSNRGALEYILANDANPSINIASGSWTYLEGGSFMLSAKDRERIHFVSQEVYPHYLITNYRGVLEKDDSKLLVDYNLVHQIKVDREPILSIYKSKK